MGPKTITIVLLNVAVLIAAALVFLAIWGSTLLHPFLPLAWCFGFGVAMAVVRGQLGYWP